MSTIPPVQQFAGMKPHRATIILVLGILSLVLCQLLGIVAWIMANKDLKEMNQGLMDPSGKGMTQAGQICGIIGTIIAAISLLVTLVWVIFVVIIGVGMAAGAGAGAGAGGP